MPEEKRVTGKVAKILDKYRVTINRGRQHGLRPDMKFYIYSEGDEILDPDDGRSLGKIEQVKAHLKVIHVQDEFSILESDDSEVAKGSISLGVSAFGGYSVMKPLPGAEKFGLKAVKESPIQIGDLIKQMPD